MEKWVTVSLLLLLDYHRFHLILSLHNDFYIINYYIFVLPNENHIF